MVNHDHVARSKAMDPMTLLVIPSIALDIVLAIAIMRGRTVGGLTFCKIGRFGFSFYFASKE
jgi:hypothetical protein